MNKIPFSVYDFFGCLSAGYLLLIAWYLSSLTDILKSELHSSAASVALWMGTAGVFFEKEKDPL